MTTARSLAVRALHEGSAVAAAEIARRASAAPMSGIVPRERAVAGFFTSSVAPLSAALQPPSMKQRSRSSVESLSFMAATLAASAFQDCGDPHAAGGANRDQAALCFGFIEYFCQRCDDASAGGGEWMPDRKAASFYVQFRSTHS